MIERLVEAAAKLNITDTNINVINKMINDINTNMSQQLVWIVNATSTHVVESNLIDNSKLTSSARRQHPVENNPKFLCQLIELAFEQFKV